MSAVLEAREPSARHPEAIQPALVRQFELLTTAEGGVTQLRELILTLAVQGKLVPQCPGEAPASEILARARAAAAEQRRERRKSASSAIEPFEPDEGSPALPLGWEWCRGADLYTVVRGVTYQKADASDSPRDDYLPILRANNIRTTINFDDLVYVPGSLVSDEQLLRSGDFVVCLASGSKNLVGKAAVFTGERVCSFGAFCGAIRLAVPLPFFSAFLASPLYREAVAEASSGIGINNLKSSTLLGLAIALPPEAEQARIVARVDELMRLCDALEAKGRLEAEQHARLLGTLLGALTDSSTPEELAANWQRVAAHLELLLDRPEAVDALEQAILQLAVRGLLVPQDSSDEPATVLLAHIRAEKAQLIADGKIKREKPLSAFDADAAPFALPRGWAWARFPELGEFGRGKSKHRPRNDPALFSPPIYPLVQTGEVARAKGTILEYHSKYSELGLAQSRLWPAGTLCITIAANIADAAVLGFDACFPDSVVGFVPASCLGGTAYFHAFLETAKTDLVRFAPATAQKNINLEILESLLVPLPPKREMERIVARVTELRRLCAELRESLTASQIMQSHVAEALVAEVV